MESLQKQLKEALELAEKERTEKEKEKAEKKEALELAEKERTEKEKEKAEKEKAQEEIGFLKGEGYTQIDQLWKPKKKVFSGGFGQIVRRRIPSWYRDTVTQLKLDDLDAASLDPRFSETGSSSRPPAESETKLDMVGRDGGEDAHCFPKSPTCSATYGIAGQAVVGCDVERHLEKKAAEAAAADKKKAKGKAKGKGGKKKLEKEDGTLSELDKRKIKALQQLVNGESGSRHNNPGLKHSPLNLIRVQGSHEEYFDNNPSVVIVPIMDLEYAKEKWTPNEPYWVVVVAKDPQKYSKVLGTMTFEDGHRELATHADLITATQLLEEMVKAHADVLHGRSHEALTPLDLFQNTTDKNILDRVNKLKEARNSLADSRVSVPELYERGHILMKVKLVPERATVPDPMLVALKAAINFSSLCGHRLLPACPSGPKVDPDEAELYQVAAENFDAYYEESIRPATPTRLAAGLMKGSVVIKMGNDHYW